MRHRHVGVPANESKSCYVFEIQCLTYCAAPMFFNAPISPALKSADDKAAVCR